MGLSGCRVPQRRSGRASRAPKRENLLLEAGHVARGRGLPDLAAQVRRLDRASWIALTQHLQRTQGNASVAMLMGLVRSGQQHSRTGTVIARGDGHLQRDGGDDEFVAKPVYVSPAHGKGDPDEVSVEGNSNVSVHGQANAKYNGGSWHTAKIKATTSQDCGECPPKTKCLHVTGDLVTDYHVKVSISLPKVPAGLSKCEAAAVRDFINTTLKKHENDHKSRFESVYNGKTVAAFDLTGCGMAAITQQLKDMQSAENADREAAANAKSGEIDPFTEQIPMNCPEDEG